MKKQLKDYLGKRKKQELKHSVSLDSDKSLAEVDGLNLQQVRKAKGKSQQELSELLNVNQAEISKMERRTDMYISTLKSYIESLGGKLEIVAKFEDSAPIVLSQFDESTEEFATPISKPEGSRKKMLSRQQKEKPPSDAYGASENPSEGLEEIWYWSICSPEYKNKRIGKSAKAKQSKIDHGWYQKLLEQPLHSSEPMLNADSFLRKPSPAN